MKILFASSEAIPFIASSGLADVSNSLPKALTSIGVDCRVMIPFFNEIPDELRSQCKFLCDFTVSLSWRRQYCGIYFAEVNGVQYYLLDNEFYFNRSSSYGYFDDAERFAFFSKACLEAINMIDFTPDVIHCNDWHTALIPVYKSINYGFTKKFSNIKTVLTIHNIGQQGKFGFEILEDVLGISFLDRDLIDYDGCVNFLKGGIELADKVTTVSPTYATEILDPWYSNKLDQFLLERKEKITGILNGIDYELYNPQTDPDIYRNYSVCSLEEKRANKKEYLKINYLTYNENVPLIGIVSRLVAQKGIDLVKYIFNELMKQNVQVAILGTGEYIYESYFQDMQKKYPDRISLHFGFLPKMAKKIYAASDFFLMPSKTEPCGLSQMIASRYGSVPIVRQTGGLKDSVIEDMENGNGFSFETYNANDMLDAIKRAISVYNNPDQFHHIQMNAMKKDFTWHRSAQEYLKLYEEICKK